MVPDRKSGRTLPISILRDMTPNWFDPASPSTEGKFETRH
jgi:hypothetical protein